MASAVLLLGAILSFLCNPATAQEESPAKKGRPNFVVILADDLAWNDIGAFGNPKVYTPNLDQLASEGMCFDQAFLTCSSCSPSRASILTGRYPHQTGAEQLHWPIPESQKIFPERLKLAGYFVAAAGKWHLGEAMRERFSVVREVDTSGFQLPAHPGTGTNDSFAESATGDDRSGCTGWVDLLRERDPRKPFFLWLASVDPHRPYEEQISSPPHPPEDIILPPYHPDTHLVRQDYARYYDEIRRLDRFVGLVLKELETQKAVENTVLIFLSDNGRPFPRDKTSLYDSGIRTPLIIRWPSTIQPASRCRQLVSVVDLAPTILELAGFPAGPSYMGKSFSSLLEGKERATRDAIFAEKNWHDYEDRSHAVRDHRFKYIINHYWDLPATPPADAARSDTFREMQRLKAEGTLPIEQSSCFLAPRPREELYDLKEDPHELRNLAGLPPYKDTLERLRVEYRQWRVRTREKTPRLRTPDEFDRVTGKPTPARIRPRWSKQKMIEEGILLP
ncbi:MAG TPA: heparan N-sulfatase [Verrucomicrobiales bacterium]|nr:heparan N-sulfatase [Verrucomicrobiales bacterium]